MQRRSVKACAMTPSDQKFAHQLLTVLIKRTSNSNTDKTLYRGELTKEETIKLTEDLKKILKEEKIPEKKHQDIISAEILNFNKAMHCISMSTAPNLADEINAWNDAFYAKIGYDKNSREYLRLNDKIFRLPIMKELLNNCLRKALEDELKKQKAENQEELQFEQEEQSAEQPIQDNLGRNKLSP